MGVLPPNFQFPFPDADVWITRPSENLNTTSPALNVFGRLKPGVEFKQATSELAVLDRQYRIAHPGMLDGRPDLVEEVTPLRDSLVGDARFMLWMLFGAVGFVRLLIACRECCPSLLLARAACAFAGIRPRCERRSARPAAGSSGNCWQRVFLLAVAGGMVGVLLAKLSLSAVTRMSGLDLPRAAEEFTSMVWSSVFCVVLLSLATGVLFGLVPAFSAARLDLAALLRANGEAANAGRKRVALGFSARGARWSSGKWHCPWCC